MAKNLTFETSVSGKVDGHHQIRGHKLDNLISEANFVSTFFLSLTGKKPSSEQQNMLNAILVASIDHGIEPSSGFVPRVVAAAGNDVYSCMASTLLALGPRHGGAITGCMEVILKLQTSNNDMESTVKTFVEQQRSQKNRISGFGHPHYRDEDPRAEQLIRIAQKNQLKPTFVQTARMIEIQLEKQVGRKLVLNVDGAIAALLLTMGIDPLAGNAIFGLARAAGSIAHSVEEMKQNKTVRRLDAKDVIYTK